MSSIAERYLEISRVLVRNGLASLSERASLGGGGEHQGSPGAAEIPLSPARLVAVLQELGTTFIKFGQMLASRPDLLSTEYREALSALTDQVPPVPFDQLSDVFDAGHGSTLCDTFASIDKRPLASASIGQAHLGTLKDGTEVVLKIRKPGVVETVNQDLEIMSTLALRLSQTWSLANELDLVGLTDAFAKTLRGELDYTTEGRVAEEFATLLADDRRVHIPKIYWDASSTRVLTQERLHGLRIDDVAGLKAAGINTKALGRRAADVMLRMVFEFGVFHADPHAGNLFVAPDGTLGVIDFGKVGRISPALRTSLANLVIAFTLRDADRMASALLELAPPRRDVDRRELTAAVQSVIDKVEDTSLGDLPVQELTGELFEIVRRHRLQIPPDLVALGLMLNIVLGVGLTLDPGFQLMDVLIPYAQRIIVQRLSPKNVRRHMRTGVLDMVDLTSEMPRDLQRLVKRVLDSGVDVRIDTRDDDPIGRLEEMSDRLVVAMLSSAMLLGAAQSINAMKDELGPLRKPILGVASAVLAGLGGYLVWGSRARVEGTNQIRNRLWPRRQRQP